MTSYTAALVLLLFAITGVVVRKTYYYLPARELKRRAESHDKLASRLYPAVAYGSSLRGLLWLWIGLSSAAGFVLLAREAPVWMSLIAVLLLLWVIHSWLPASRVTKVGALLTTAVTPVIVWLLNYLHPLSSRGTELAQRRYTAHAHTGLFERDDLLELIEQQQRQPDNRLSEEELEIARRALSFSDYKVADILTPRKKVKTALVSDVVGPVLINELHKNGQGYMLVRESAKGDFVGTLAFKHLSINSTGQVRDAMDEAVFYLHENDSLAQALHAFFKTNQPIFVVVNSFEEYVGIVTIENILKQLLGHIPGDDFDGYGDSIAVAARHQKKTEEPAAEQERPAEEKPGNSPEEPPEPEKVEEKAKDAPDEPEAAETPVKTDE